MKTLTGRTLAASEFSFELWEGMVKLQTVSNLANGSFSFASINYTLANVGVHTYTVKEFIPTVGLGGVTYDTKTYTVTVTVSDKGDGTLNVVLGEASDSPTGLNFTNTYAASGSLDLSGTKTLTGRTLAAGEFSFELWEGMVKLQTVTNAANGTFTFGTINYTLANVGVHTYTVIEKTGVLGGVT